eukprot:COSAG05_NODE_1848_length_3967_cov_4.117632_1_plen_104_part_00
MVLRKPACDGLIRCISSAGSSSSVSSAGSPAGDSPVGLSGVSVSFAVVVVVAAASVLAGGAAVAGAVVAALGALQVPKLERPLCSSESVLGVSARAANKRTAV